MYCEYLRIGRKRSSREKKPLKKMSERLLRPKDAAKKLGISRPTFYKLRSRLIAQGMKAVRVGRSPKYLESSIDALILRAAEKEQALV